MQVQWKQPCTKKQKKKKKKKIKVQKIGRKRKRKKSNEMEKVCYIGKQIEKYIKKILEVHILKKPCSTFKATSSFLWCVLGRPCSASSKVPLEYQINSVIFISKCPPQSLLVHLVIEYPPFADLSPMLTALIYRVGIEMKVTSYLIRILHLKSTGVVAGSLRQQYTSNSASVCGKEYTHSHSETPQHIQCVITDGKSQIWSSKAFPFCCFKMGVHSLFVCDNDCHTGQKKAMCAHCLQFVSGVNSLHEGVNVHTLIKKKSLFSCLKTGDFVTLWGLLTSDNSPKLEKQVWIFSIDNKPYLQTSMALGKQLPLFGQTTPTMFLTSINLGVFPNSIFLQTPTPNKIVRILEVPNFLFPPFFRQNIWLLKEMYKNNQRCVNMLWAKYYYFCITPDQ
ncbi:hypothetical protein VP01_769g2 [Puccinia sorghi]|uniref:Uncharacterized protein n=1 Tax=Puccinia sorghi TaxID=27349 RepID=A0A0L6UBK5_9BASI|nr:hypothetical protein VP01_769g2 [Puccinia sorghi]